MGRCNFLRKWATTPAGLNPDIGNFIRLHRPIEPAQDMLDKVLPYANYWHVKNYLRDEDPKTGQVMTFPVPSGCAAVGRGDRAIRDHRERAGARTH